MTWCSDDSATPRFVLASSAIRCRFVDRFVRLRVLSRVSRQRFSSHDTPAPFTATASAQWKFRGYRAALAPAAYASRVALPPPLQSSLPAGRLAFTGRELNPLDRYKRFQITHSPFLDLS